MYGPEIIWFRYFNLQPIRLVFRMNIHFKLLQSGMFKLTLALWGANILVLFLVSSIWILNVLILWVKVREKQREAKCCTHKVKAGCSIIQHLKIHEFELQSVFMWQPKEKCKAILRECKTCWFKLRVPLFLGFCFVFNSSMQ